MPHNEKANGVFTRLLYLLPRILVWAMSLYIGFMAFQDFQLGGNAWKQGDWLINNVEAIVRRGILGSAILHISRALLVDPVLAVVILQSLMLALSVVLLNLSVSRFRCRNTLWLLILSPGFFISLWALDPQGGLRKELIVFLAFSLLLFGVTRTNLSKPLVYLSAVILSIAFFGHEGNVCFLPFFAFCYIALFTKGKLSSGDLYALSGLLATTSLAAVVLAFSFGNVDDHLTVCQPLLDAGSRSGICDGAIKSLEIGLHEFVQATFWMALSPRLLSFVLMYGLTAVSILLIGSYIFEPRVFFRYYFGSALVFLPLYVVAVDWGRWLSFHTTSVVYTMLIVLGLSASMRASKADTPPMPFAALLAISTLWGTSHFVYVQWGGILLKGLDGLYHFLDPPTL